jgi:isoquinoline 1-oxidoreductase subunit alpha
MMQLNVNGNYYEVDDDPNEMLIWVLREQLGLTGTKPSCAIGICGTCTVHVEGQAIRACVTPLAAVAGLEIRTIEGLATQNPDGTETLHPVQQAFIDFQVPQCAWCMSGQMMTAVAFLAQTPNPSEDDVTNAMSNNYCRCGCYPRVRQAVAKAAELAKERL